ncbi:MAG: oxidase [Planctomycetota bacterium]|nr:MAG: oxidase [Planctomycetota bacterium]
MNDTAHAETHHLSVKTYSVIGGILVVGTILAFVFVDAIQMSWMATVLAIFGIATFKSLLVAMYFMHLKFERGWKWILTIPPLLLVAALIFALLPDVARFGAYG